MKAIDQYRVDRQAQDARYENLTGLPVGEEWRQEFRDYFGVGDHAGRPVESRVTPHAAMVNSKAEAQPDGVITEAQAFELSGDQLAELAASGDWQAGAEIVRRAVKRWQSKGMKGRKVAA